MTFASIRPLSSFRQPGRDPVPHGGAARALRRPSRPPATIWYGADGGAVLPPTTARHPRARESNRPAIAASREGGRYQEGRPIGFRREATSSLRARTTVRLDSSLFPTTATSLSARQPKLPPGDTRKRGRHAPGS